MRDHNKLLLVMLVIAACLTTGCLGPREVHEEWSPGIAKRHGFLSGGKQQGEWTYWHDNGVKSAEGSWFQDKQDGTWTWWYPDGRIQRTGQYQAQGIDLSNRSSSPRVGVWRSWYDNGQLESMGAYDDDRQTGTWSYFTKDGAPYAQGNFSGSLKHGDWIWWHANGQRREAGQFENGIKVGPWTTWDETGEIVKLIQYTVNGKPVPTDSKPPVVITSPPPVPAPSSPQNVAPPPALSPIVTRRSALSEQKENATDSDPAAISSVSTTAMTLKPAAPELVLPPPDAFQLSPAPAAPALWTKAQETNAAGLIQKYTDGRPPPNLGYTDKQFGAKGDRQRRDLLGTPFKQNRFLGSKGDVLDISDLRKKGPVILVILRGFSGQVCLYCAAQTTAISNNIKRFTERNIPVVVVYPGPVDAVPSFLEAVRSLAKSPPPMPVGLDVSLLAVRSLKIEDNLAIPTSLIIDEEGVIQYAYQGKTIADRPTVEELLEAADKVIKKKQ